MADQPSNADAAEVAALIHTALYDTGGESVEGAFVDRWESYALTAIDELKEIFQRRGFTPADEELLRKAVCEVGAPTEAAVTLLRCLRSCTLPLLDKLLTSGSPEGQAAAYETLAKLGKPDAAHAGLSDPNPLVRHASIRAIIAGPGSASKTETHLIRALDDPDPQIRITAAQNLDVCRRAGAKALIARFRREESAEIRDAILLHIAETVRREGIDCRGDALLRHVGKDVRRFLAEQLADHPDPMTRYEVARALERLPCPEIGRLFLQRLEAETDDFPRAGLLEYPAFREIGDEAFPVLATLLTDPSPAVRTGATFALGSFPERAVPDLMRMLEDPEEHIRRSAAMSLGRCNAGIALPRLLKALWDPSNRRYSREFESAVRDVSCYVLGPPPGTPDAELSARIQERVDEIQATEPGAWPHRVCKEEFNAVLLFGTQLDMWCLQPDGTLLCWDTDSFSHEGHPETRPRYHFAVMLRGAMEYPELTSLIPKRPDNVRLCDHCKGRGWYSTAESPKVSCLVCDYLGWMERQ
jgi:HEAT repeat protein